MDDGYLSLVGRIKELINRGGAKIAPRDIGELLLAHDVVREAVTSGVPDAEYGERVEAAVVVTSSLTLAELSRHCADRLVRFKLPARVRVVREIPVRPTGKVARAIVAQPTGFMRVAVVGACAPFAEALADAGIGPRVVEDIRAQACLKLMGNAVFNPLTCSPERRSRRSAAPQSTRSLAAALVEDVLAVALALGRTPPVSIGGRVAGAERVGDHRTSMLQDLQAGKKLELDPLTSAVIELARLAGVDVPRLQTLHAATDLMARKRGAR